jgi:NAD(P)H-flavin reductase
LIGLIIGAIVTPAWLLYDKNRVKDSFTVYKLVRKEPVSSTAGIFYLDPQDKSTDFEVYRRAWRQGIWNVHFKQPQIQIVRAYTPLPPIDACVAGTDGQLRFLIRRDKTGEVSDYIHNLPTGANIELRGPNLEYALPEHIQQVVFFAGGTGIAPALQVAHAMFKDPSMKEEPSGSPKRRLHILWANRWREDCVGGVSDSLEESSSSKTWDGLFSRRSAKDESQSQAPKGAIVSELEALKERYPGQLTVDYFVNEEGTWINADAVQKVLTVFGDMKASASNQGNREERQIIISGPPGFISYLAGPKEWRNGREEQGALGNLLAHTLAKTSQEVKVWKV